MGPVQGGIGGGEGGEGKTTGPPEQKTIQRIMACDLPCARAADLTVDEGDRPLFVIPARVAFNSEQSALASKLKNLDDIGKSVC